MFWTEIFQDYPVDKVELEIWIFKNFNLDLIYTKKNLNFRADSGLPVTDQLENYFNDQEALRGTKEL